MIDLTHRSKDKEDAITAAVIASMRDLRHSAQGKKLCLDCVCLEAATSYLALVLIQGGAIDVAAGTVNEARLGKVLQTVMDIVMADVREMVRDPRGLTLQ